MRPRLPAATVTLPLVAAALVGSSTAGVAARPAPDVTLTPLSTYATGAFDEGASEITAHDAGTHRVFVVNAQVGTVDILDISDPSSPQKVGQLDTPGANSVAVHDGLVAGGRAGRGEHRPRLRGLLRRRDGCRARPCRGGLASGHGDLHPQREPRRRGQRG